MVTWRDKGQIGIRKSWGSGPVLKQNLGSGAFLKKISQRDPNQKIILLQRACEMASQIGISKLHFKFEFQIDISN